ncbi:MAG: TIM barrel protein, partial [Bacteroidota bacterium]
MNRRTFVKNTFVAGTAAAASSGSVLASPNAQPKAESFQMKYAPHLGMFKHSAGDDPIDQLNFMADMGFTAFEDNGMKNREIATQEKMASTMAKRGLEMGVFVAHKIYWNEANLAGGDADLLEEFLSNIKDSVEVAKRVNATWMTVVPGHVAPRLNMAYQTQNVVDALKRACEILEPHNLVMVLEPLNFFNHPGLFLTGIPQAYQI